MNVLQILTVRGGTAVALKRLVLRADAAARRAHQGFFLVVQGFDEDSRDLWEIEEALALMKKLVDLGCLSALAPNLQ